MKPLIVLLVSFVIALITTKLALGNFDAAFSARVAMVVMLVFTSIGHFAFSKGMVMMVPDFIPFKKEMVYFTGIIEIIFAAALFIPTHRIVTAWLLILFFILLMPANIKAANRHINYEKGTFDGNGLSYLWFRIPLQILFILWVYFSVIK